MSRQNLTKEMKLRRWPFQHLGTITLDASVFPSPHKMEDLSFFFSANSEQTLGPYSTFMTVGEPRVHLVLRRSYRGPKGQQRWSQRAHTPLTSYLQSVLPGWP